MQLVRKRTAHTSNLGKKTPIYFVPFTQAVDNELAGKICHGYVMSPYFRLSNANCSYNLCSTFTFWGKGKLKVTPSKWGNDSNFEFLPSTGAKLIGETRPVPSPTFNFSWHQQISSLSDEEELILRELCGRRTLFSVFGCGVFAFVIFGDEVGTLFPLSSSLSF